MLNQLDVGQGSYRAAKNEQAISKYGDSWLQKSHKLYKNGVNNHYGANQRYKSDQHRLTKLWDYE